QVVARGGALEQHVLEQVRQARFARALDGGADVIVDRHGHGGLRAIGHEQEAEAVVERVFGHAFVGDDFARRQGLGRWRRGGGGGGEGSDDGGDDGERGDGGEAHGATIATPPARPRDRAHAAPPRRYLVAG